MIVRTFSSFSARMTTADGWGKTWSQGPDAPWRAVFEHAAVSVGDRVFVLGGCLKGSARGPQHSRHDRR